MVNCSTRQERNDRNIHNFKVRGSRVSVISKEERVELCRGKKTGRLTRFKRFISKRILYLILVYFEPV